jgi:(S)-2-hydroxyglutarate dehydrogenase
MQQQNITIIGAGIVGLSTAYNLLQQNPRLKVTVLEKEDGPARHQTGHNSGVIHSGIYYKPGSAKALNCKRGYDQLLNFCKEYGIQHDLCGKVIVATKAEERPLLDNIFKRGQENGLTGIRKISAEETREIEPHVKAVEAIWVPQTGIIDYKDVAAKYAELIEQRGGTIRYGAKVIGIKAQGSGSVVETSQGNPVATELVINCAGLYSDKVTALTEPEMDWKVLPFRGEYYELRKDREHLVRNLIYPVPNPNFPFLGVHFTRMIKGGIEAGPNAVLAFRREGYSRWQIHLGELSETLLFPGFRKIATKYWDDGWMEMKRSFSKALFVKALQELIPEISSADVHRAGAGVRAQACTRDGQLMDDFHIVRRPGVINVCNAPSPAATASLAIGETIAQMALGTA